jgi:hypothetical protein
LPTLRSSQQGDPFALLRVPVLVDWESSIEPDSLSVTVNGETIPVPIAYMAPGRYGNIVTIPVLDGATSASLRVRAVTNGSGSTITKTIPLEVNMPYVYKLKSDAYGYPAGTTVYVTTPTEPAPVYDPVLLAKSAAAPYRLTADQAGWHNTGVPAGVALTPVTQDYRVVGTTTTPASLTLENMDIRGSIYVERGTVILKNSRITDTGMAIQTGTGGSVLMEDCEVDGAAGGAQVKVGYSNITARRCRIRRGVDLTRLSTNNLFEDCFLTDLVEADPYHNDCTQSDQGTGTVYRRCSFIGFNDGWVQGQSPGANSPMILKPDNGDITNFVVDSCVFGGGNAVYLSGVIPKSANNDGGRMVNLTFTNNLFHGDSLHADLAIQENMAYLKGFSGNRKVDGSDFKVLVYKNDGTAANRYYSPAALEAAAQSATA